MNLLIIGGDMRYAKIIRDLKDKNNISTIGYDNTIFENIKKFNIMNDDLKEIDIIILPILGIKDDYSVDTTFSKNKIVLPYDFFFNTKKSVKIFTGKINDTLRGMVPYEESIINILDDKDVTRENSLVTVEGIIENLISNRGTNTITMSNILVLGYGNIATPLVDVLKALGANVSVGVKKSNDFVKLLEKDVDVFKTSDTYELNERVIKAKTIINTVPNHVIPSNIVKNINKDCYILDVASAPFGFNNEEMKDKSYFIYSKIPSIYSPTTSGLILEKKINSVSGGKL